MFFGSFYDEDKSQESNKKESEKARHNRDVMLCVTAAIGLVTAVATASMALKKVVKEIV
ncbi:hypothetical protein ST201phi2-1p166 [Pseudomonas phage 201phi2-1]|uniref:Uncharacterized protein n=1 Tax=Pseudomonas phage 201phi2-1 TaxID=198110 RepID=B3FJ29_BP201|nr:hypothetical protein ST201phi2-1p166 [Pseudomonas phage 201phi2-1]ABY62996.1 hypothetical protein 201phi2-1p166 [Pseudomonas phage 201phi2-1]